VPVALLVLAAAPKVIPAGRATGPRTGFDTAGAGAVTGGVLLLVYALTETSWPAGVAALALLGAFVAIERHRRNPLVPLDVLRSRRLASANLAALAWACATIGWQYPSTSCTCRACSGTRRWTPGWGSSPWAWPSSSPPTWPDG
jgi:hypothetical protein